MADSPTPRTRLTSIKLSETSLVPAGDNPGARVVLSKAREAEPAEDVEQPPSVVDKVRRWLAQKMPFATRTTAEILAHDEFRDEFSKLRWAFMRSIDGIMDMAPSEDTSDLLRKTVEEFTGISQSLVGDVTKADPTAGAEMLDILKDLSHFVAEPADSRAAEKAQAGFAETLERLEKFEPPDAAEESDVVDTNKSEPKSIAEILKTLSDDDRIAVEAELAKKAEPAPVEEPESPDVLKGLPDDVQKAINDRFAALEQRTEKAETAAEEMKKAQREQGYVAKAKKLGVDGVDVSKAARLIEAIEGADEETAKAAQEVLSALAAQARKGRRGMLSVVGSDSRDGDVSSAEKQIEARAEEIRKATPGTTKEEAYTKALRENPDLYEEMLDEGELEEIDDEDAA